MSKINGEKARSAIARRRRTAQREKDRAALAQIKAGAGKTEEAVSKETVAPPRKTAAKSKTA